MFQSSGVPVATGRFRERMTVELVNDGPVTIWIDSTDRHRPRD
jgi:D-tyrosyl-tRNA(Tyr) deacylase